MAQVPAARRNQSGGMTARRENPLERLQRDFDAIFGRLGAGWLMPLEHQANELWLWDFDVTENDREIVVRAEMPGFEENEIDVQIDDGVLTIRGEKEQRGDRQEERIRFFRSVTLPPGVNAEKAQATYRNGVLELHLPRAEGAQSRRVQIQSQPNGGTQGAKQTASGQAGSPTVAGSRQGQQPGEHAGSAADKTKK